MYFYVLLSEVPVIYLVSVELGVPCHGFVAPTYRFSLLASGLLLSSSQQWQAKSFSCSISFREGNGNPLQYSCLENPMDGGAWWAIVHGVAKSQTRLSDFTFTFMHWRRKWQPTPVFLPGESQGQGSVVGCCLWGCTELDTTEVT